MKSFIFAEISSFLYPEIVPWFFPTCFSSYQSVICPQYTIYEQRKSDLKTISCGTILCECRMQHLTRAGLVMHSKDGFRHVCVPLHVCNICMFMCIFSHDDIFTHNPLNMRIKTKPRQICGSLSFCCSFFLVFLLCV